MKTDLRLLVLAAGLLVNASVPAFAQQPADSAAVVATAAQSDESYTIIEGTVMDGATGKGIDGATLRMNGVAYFTKADGTYRIRSKNPTTIITVTAPGYDTRDVEWRGRNHIDIELLNERFETPVTSRPHVTPAESQLVPTGSSYDQIEDIELSLPQYTFENVLHNRVGTVRNISRNGTAGIGSVMYIRGLNSIQSNSQPLIVVDGVIMENYQDIESLHGGFYANSFANLNVNDIENITVIKDATALYGAKAANGVILIETKRGHDMVTKIVVNAAAGVSVAPQTIPTLNADQHRLLVSESLKGANVTQKAIDDMALFRDDKTYLYYSQNHNQTNWTDWVYNDNGINQAYSARATGGDAVGMYALSVGYTNNKGLVKNTTMDHLNFRFNSDIEVAKKIKSAVDFSLSSVNYDVLNDGMMSPTSPSYISLVKSPNYYPYTYSRVNFGSLTTNLEEADDLGISNPVSIIENAEQMSKMTMFTAAAKPVWTINKDWKLMGIAAYGLDKSFESYFTPMQGVAPVMKASGAGGIETYENEARSQNMRDIHSNLEARLSYNKSLGEHHISALFGTRLYNKTRTWDVCGGYNTGDDDQVHVNNSLYYKKLTGEDLHVRNLSWYLNGNWDYAQKYFLNAAVSMEASSRFGTQIEGAMKMLGVNWAFFPSVSGAWLISSEDAFANAEKLDLLRLRASFGLTGNDDIEDLVSYTLFTSQNFIERATGLVLYNLSNPTVKWETTSKANIGLDAAFFGDRLSASLDAYYHHSYDLLVQKELRKLSGFQYYWANDGDLINKGLELSVNFRPVNRRNFRWEMSASAAHNVNKITHLANGNYTTSVYDAEMLTAEGESLAVFYGYKALGVFSTQEQAATAHTAADGSKTYLYKRNEDTSLSPYNAGDMIFEDVDNNGIIDDKDKQIIGNPNPDLFGVFNNTFTFKGVSLSALFNYSIGNDVYNYQRRALESMTDYSNQSMAVTNRWRYEGQQTSMPKASYKDPIGNSAFSSRWIENASYLRLKSLTLAWEIPFKIPYINAAKIFFTAENPFIWTKYLGCDPEASVSNNVFYQGIDAGMMPQLRSFIGGLRLNL